MKNPIEGQTDASTDGRDDDSQSDPVADEKGDEEDWSSQVHLGVCGQVPRDAVALKDETLQ